MQLLRILMQPFPFGWSPTGKPWLKSLISLVNKNAFLKNRRNETGRAVGSACKCKLRFAYIDGGYLVMFSIVN